MKLIAFAALAGLSLVASTQARAADLSPDTKRMLSYGTVAVMSGACNLRLPPADEKRMKAGLAKYADLQKDLTEEEFTESMKAAGAQIGQNKAEVCGSLSPQVISTMLDEAEDGN